MKRFFIAGTDTDVGKTLVSVALLQAANKKGLTTAALKPVAAGCEYDDGDVGKQTLLNGDALALQNAITESLPYSTINPFALEPPIAPHIAAAQVGMMLDAATLAKACQSTLCSQSDVVLVEGAGGWRVPLNGHETLADLAVLLKLPVVLVVGLRLGCINHALLSAEAITRDGLTIAGWVANQVDDAMPVVDENIATLKERFDFPFLGHIPFLSKPSGIDAAKFLDIGKLLDN